MKMKSVLLGALAATILASSGPPAAFADSAICYNCPPQWADWASQLKAMLVGRVLPHDRGAFDRALGAARAASRAQILVHDHFVPERDVQRYFELADVVLGTYQRHVGSSGILIRAAAAGTPVLASDYGLLGEQTRRHRIGLAVDSRSTSAVAETLERLLGALDPGDPTSPIWDLGSMKSFAAANTPRSYADTLLNQIAPASRPAQL